MPIYAYRCTACDFEKDYLQKLSDPVLTVCPQCSKAAFSKQVTAAGFQLKGSGWYATDFKNAAKSKTGNGEDKTEAPKAESEKSESAKVEAGKSEAPKAESAKAEVTKGEPSKSESAKSEAKKSESSTSESKSPAVPPPATNTR